MFGMSNRNYLIVGVLIGGLCYLINLFALAGVMNFLDVQAGAAAAAGLPPGIVNLVIEPMRFAFSGVVGAVIAGIIWPLLLFWVVLLLILIVLGFFGPGFETAAGSIR